MLNRREARGRVIGAGLRWRRTRGRRVPVLIAALTALVAPGCTMPEPIRVMSFNIRFSNTADGPNRWEARRELALRVVRDADPDIVGFQEALASQVDEIAAALPDYQCVGVGRDDGARAGEFVPIFFRRQRFELVGGSHFWLSDDPHTVGTVGWDAALPRMATWVRLRFRDRPLTEVYVLNTHFDHRGARARLESAKLLSRTIESLGGLPIVVMGDFNCGPGSPPYVALLNERSTSAGLCDSYAVASRQAAAVAVRAGQATSGTAAPAASPDSPSPRSATSAPSPTSARSSRSAASHAQATPERMHGTYHGFDGIADTLRIDWILHNRRFVADAADIIRTSASGRYPSDHFPVTATLRLVAATDVDGK